MVYKNRVDGKMPINSIYRTAVIQCHFFALKVIVIFNNMFLSLIEDGNNMLVAQTVVNISTASGVGDQI